MQTAKCLLAALALATAPIGCRKEKKPDLTNYLFVCSNWSDDTILVFSPDSEPQTTLTPPSCLNHGVPRFKWSPDGSKVIICENQLLWVAEETITEFPLPGSLEGWSPDGQWVWLYEPEAELVYQVRPDGTDAQAVAQIAPLQQGQRPRISPFGERMVWYGEHPETHDSTGLFVQDLPAGQPWLLECLGMDSEDVWGLGGKVHWSMDARSLWWIEFIDLQYVIVQCQIGTGNIVALVRSDQAIFNIELSLNGKYLVYSVHPDSADDPNDVYAVNLVTREITQLTDRWHAVLWAWTSDSKYVIVSDWDAQNETATYYAVSVPGGRAYSLTFADCDRPATPSPQGQNSQE